MTVTYRDWIPTDCEKRAHAIATQIATSPSDAIFAHIQNLAKKNASFIKKNASISIQQQMS